MEKLFIYPEFLYLIHQANCASDRKPGWEADTKEENTNINNDRSQQSKTNPKIEATKQKDSSLETSVEDKVATDHLSDNASQVCKVYFPLGLKPIIPKFI